MTWVLRLLRGAVAKDLPVMQSPVNGSSSAQVDHLFRHNGDQGSPGVAQVLRSKARSTTTHPNSWDE